MKLFVLSLVAFLPLYAFGDFIPGRVRAAAHAELVRSNGDGRYANTRGAEVIAFKTDDKGYTGVQISLDHRSEVPFTVTQIQQNRCGSSMIAAFDDGAHASQLRIDQVSLAACRSPGRPVWRVTLTTKEPDGIESRLVLQGTPSYYRLSK